MSYKFNCRNFSQATVFLLLTCCCALPMISAQTSELKISAQVKPFIEKGAAANSSAGDYADLKFIGFSGDGKYLAFEESGEWDVHSGGDYAKTFFVDVAKNVYAAAPSVYDFSENNDLHARRFSQAARLKRYQESVAAGIKRFKIIRGNLGKLVVAHLTTDRSFEKPVIKESYFIQSDGMQIKKMSPFYDGGNLSGDYNPSKVIFNPDDNPVNARYDEFYELNLSLTKPKQPCSENGEIREFASKIELVLKDNTHHTDLEPQILQKDERIPEARHCADFYQIEQIYFYKDNLAVFLNFSYGYPNQSRRYMVVSGRLDYESGK